MNRLMRKFLCMILAAGLCLSMPLGTFAATEDGGEYQTHVFKNVLGKVIEIPLTDQDNPETEGDDTINIVIGDPAGTVTPEGDATHTVKEQGSLSVSTMKILTRQVMTMGDVEMEFVASETEPDADNDMAFSGKSLVDMPESATDYQYIYRGSINMSQLTPTYLYETPTADREAELVYTDENGQEYYLGQPAAGVGARYKVEGLFLDGELCEPYTNSYPNVYSTAQQFEMYNIETGEHATAYCADVDTGADEGFLYNIENLDEATHYDPEYSAKIRTVALNGYFGNLDDPSTPEPEPGSLEAVKQMMRDAEDEDGNKIFTEEDIAILNDGIALTATQMSIWQFTNSRSDIHFTNAHYVNKNSSLIFKTSYGIPAITNVPDSEKAGVELAFKLYDYLTGLDPNEISRETTANTIINEDNFMESVSLEFKEQSGDKFVADLIIKPVVAVENAQKDDLVIYLYDESGDAVAAGRIAGTLQEGEILLTPDENGCYRFEDLEIFEGEQVISVQLKGAQNLSRGAFLFTSEVKDGVDSQSMVGIATGTHKVDITMDIGFDFGAELEVIEVKEPVDAPPAIEPSGDRDPDFDMDQDQDDADKATKTDDPFNPVIPGAIALAMLVVAVACVKRRKV